MTEISGVFRYMTILVWKTDGEVCGFEHFWTEAEARASKAWWEETETYPRRGNHYHCIIVDTVIQEVI